MGCQGGPELQSGALMGFQALSRGSQALPRIPQGGRAPRNSSGFLLVLMDSPSFPVMISQTGWPIVLVPFKAAHLGPGYTLRRSAQWLSLRNNYAFRRPTTLGEGQGDAQVYLTVFWGILILILYWAILSCPKAVEQIEAILSYLESLLGTGSTILVSLLGLYAGLLWAVS